MNRLYVKMTNVIYPLESDQKSAISEFLFKFLIPKDLNTFLGLRTTVGSALQLPPSFSECIESFTKVYVKTSAQPPRRTPKGLIKANTLTVGAKAFSKHCHRDISGTFWGVCTGTEKQKNEQANRVLARIMTNAAWINLHSLPHNTRVYEIRMAEGYGARWEIYDQVQRGINIPQQNPTDNSPHTIFRGFLEPQMEDGHAKGWVH